MPFQGASGFLILLSLTVTIAKQKYLLVKLPDEATIKIHGKEHNI